MDQYMSHSKICLSVASAVQWCHPGSRPLSQQFVYAWPVPEHMPPVACDHARAEWAVQCLAGPNQECIQASPDWQHQEY